jgi:hypothetical protein
MVDRLVDGELREEERRELLLRLDSEPDGWRHCALAFLEAQEWRAAFAPLTVTAPAPAPRVPVLEGPGRKPRFRYRLARHAGLAAGLAVAFCLGWALHGTPAEKTPFSPLAREEKTATPGQFSLSEAASADLAKPTSPPSGVAEPHALLEPVVERWEQQGYRAQSQAWLVVMQLPDGRRVEMPIQEVRVQHIGNRLY